MPQLDQFIYGTELLYPSLLLIFTILSILLMENGPRPPYLNRGAFHLPSSSNKDSKDPDESEKSDFRGSGFI